MLKLFSLKYLNFSIPIHIMPPIILRQKHNYFQNVATKVKLLTYSQSKILFVNPIIFVKRIYNYFYNFQQSFTSNWPKTLWMAVDQRGVHLLEFRTRNVLNSFEYDSILDYTPSLNHMLLITGTDKKQSKIIVNTNQVCTLQSPFKISILN